MKTTLAAVLVGLVAVSGVAAAHTQSYVNITGDILVICDILGDGSELNEGGACLAAGHVAGPTASITIADDILSPTSGFYDQDLDGDGTGDGVVAAGFCGSITLNSGVNWDESGSIIIWADGPIFGNPLLSVCGTLSLTVLGTVSHS
jgi:hypothetical protein